MGADLSKMQCCSDRATTKAAITDTVPKQNAIENSESDDDENFVTQTKGATKDNAAKQQCLHEFPNEEKEYEKKDKIGSGGFGEVFNAVCTTMNNEEVAIKILDLDNAGCDIMEVFNEVNLMCEIKHPHILDLHATFPVDDKLWMVMPYVRFGSVRQILDFTKPLAGSGGFNDEKLIASIMKQCLEALAYCHSQPQPIIHRDVKAANILISETGHCMLMDFGVSKSLENHTTKKAAPGKLKRTNSYVGTASWMAPEVSAVDIMDDGTCHSSSSYGTKADIWSFGITMMEMAYGCPPHGNDGEAEYREFTVSRNKPPPKNHPETESYKSLSTRDKMSAIQHGPVVYKNMRYRKSSMSPNFVRCIEKCLTIDPDDRPTAKHLLKSSFWKKAKDANYIQKTLLTKIPRDYLETGGRSTAQQRDALKDV